MSRKRQDLSTVHFGALVEALREADDVNVLLRGHLWVEALLEYAARGKLKRPDAIDWSSARFEHKIALAEAVGALDEDLADGVRQFNRLRNRLAHDFEFQVTAGDIAAVIGSLKEAGQKAVGAITEQQLEVYHRVEEATAAGMDVEFAPEMEWYPRVMTPARAQLFAFVVFAARALAIKGAFGAANTMESSDLMAFLDSEVTRLTGGLYTFRPARAPRSAPAEKPDSPS